MRDPYAVLGLPKGSSLDEVRTAYRSIVKQHHPDHSKAAGSVEIFMRATEAYDLLSDPVRKQAYDAAQRTIDGVRQKTAAENVIPQGAQKSRPSGLSADVNQLVLLMKRGHFIAAESLAKKVAEADPYEPIAFGVLGDIARSKGHFREAAENYSYAAQLDPSNTNFEARHKEMLTQLNVRYRPVAQREETKAAAYLIPAATLFAGSSYVALAREHSLFPSLSLCSSFTLGLVVMAMIVGIVTGVSFGMSGVVDRFAGTAFDSFGRLSPPLALGLVSFVNFWVAGLIYFAIGAIQHSFQYSTSRILGATAVAVLVFGLAASLSPSLNMFQVLLWSGNLVYPACLLGWMVSDAFRSR